MVENQININHQAYKELGLLFILVAVAILTFSSLVYFAERDYYGDTGVNCTAWEPDYNKGRAGSLSSHLISL